MRRPAVTHPVFGRSADQRARLRQRPHDEVALRMPSCHHRDIDFPLVDLVDSLDGLHHQLDVGMPLEEATDRGDDDVLPDAAARADRQRPSQARRAG